jgi:hypothetical protein
LKILSATVILTTLTSLLLADLISHARAEAGSDGVLSVPLATLLSAPDSYEGKRVLIQGKIIKVTSAIFPNGRRYYTLTVGEAGSSVEVFSWNRPNVRPGDSVRIKGTFHVWRYNIHHMIEKSSDPPT